LVLHATQQLVQALMQLQFQQQHHLLIQFSLLLLSLLLLSLPALSSQPLSSQPFLQALRRHHLQRLLLVQPSSRLSLQALALQVEHRASIHRVQRERVHDRLVGR
jgi:hypothetical protein